MDNFVDITREKVPCWYELSFDKGKPAIFGGGRPSIIVRVHRNIIDSAKGLPTERCLLLFKDFGFEEFNGSIKDNNFGFDNALQRRDEGREFVEFIATIYSLRQEETEECSYCNGTGKLSFSFEHEGVCHNCNGSGRVKKISWKQLQAISASLCMLFSRPLFYPEIKTSSSCCQLMTVETTCQQGQSGSSIGGNYSIALCEWLRSLYQTGQRIIPEIIEAMKIVYDHAMIGFPISSVDAHRFGARIDSVSGRLLISYPGDACSIAPVRYMNDDNGYEFGSHNVDSPAQQLGLLAGLAAMHDRARREIPEGTP